ncbi:Ankyrin repeat-containing protein [Glarea lozoyensis ATCC 20868]|uniref:Ankyrin repeat-containing protein n=1 Tax=Glarea lozoyensis (strain ATCC 20868 / MF5171) TaxID=1116229 RepID=S3DBM1_GLAL2|nr:Ankyrin repeat-containing protein [Glarea lozoyensis ATCC 20868]EPE35822.1 Ankyrin repeat-containing protein [Glarea lozoyensis ATCC 20868]
MMHLLEYNSDGEFKLTTFLADEIPQKYAILSHTWGPEEVDFEDLRNGTGRKKIGYEKIRFCGEQAKRDGLQYFWVDTCCIDKSSSAELTESINSMFRWYSKATKCYVYLSDVSSPDDKIEELAWETAFRESRWFTRGWTLQELIAPKSVEFFSNEGIILGDKSSLERQICETTGIPGRVLRESPLSDFSVTERMSWAERRQTTREEDRAYSMLGIFEVYMPLIYGEGKQHAFRRLQEEIDKRSSISNEVKWTDMERECVQALRTSDYEQFKNRNPDRLEGTCQWVLQHDNFNTWQKSESSSLLWVSADPGCGKSVLSKSLIDQDLKSKQAGAMCYFFFKDDNQTQQNIATAISAILHQLFSQNPMLIKYAMKDYEADGHKLPESFHTLWDIFIKAVADPKAGEVFCILDALDECAEEGRYQIINAVNQLYQKAKPEESTSQLKFLITSRPYLDIERRLSDLTSSYPKIRLQGEQEYNAISREIDLVIRRRVRKLSSELRLNHLEQSTLEAELLRTTHRTYLWLTLILDIVRGTINPTSRKLRATINNLPTTVNKAYEAILSKIGEDEKPLAWKLFHIIVAAARPLTLQEMNVALAIDRQHQSYSDLDLDSEARFEATVKNISGLFVTVVDHKVYLIHQTAKDFLCTQTLGDPTMGFKINLGDAHAVLAEICLQYLTLSDFNVPIHEGLTAAIWNLTSKHSLLKYAAVNWSMHLKHSGISSESILFQQELMPRLLWFLNPEEYPYTFRTWRQVTRATHPLERAFTHSPLCFSIRMGLQVLVDMLLPQLLDVDTHFEDGFTCLTAAASGNRVSIIQKLLELGANVDLATKDRGLTPLHLAAGNACEETVVLLLSAGASLHARSLSGTTPFYRAARGGSLCILSLLYDYGSEVDAKTWDNWTPLMEAVENGHTSATKLLLTWGANPLNRSSYGSTPLSLASDLCRIDILAILQAAIQDLPQDHLDLENSMDLTSEGLVDSDSDPNGAEWIPWNY